MHPTVKQLAEEYKEGLRALYGDELVELILFGSYARGDQHEESDVDFAVVLRSAATRTATEVLKISPLASDLYFKYGLMVSALPVSLQKKQASMQGVYQNIRMEGIVV